MVNKACNSVKDVIEFLYIEVRTSAAVIFKAVVVNLAALGCSKDLV